jgi:HK97 family phage major capsid protein/HK97 family phage prohead protease
MESFKRRFEINTRIDSDQDSGGFWATLSTEYPVPRGYGNEVLLHGRDNIDLERVSLPLIVGHNTEEINIGVVEQLKIVGRKLKGFIRLGSSARAKEILADIKNGIVSNLSIGYRILEHHFQGDDLIATKWAPHEVSILAVGADPHAGIGRSFNFEEHTMTERNETLTVGGKNNSKQDRNADAGKERQRVLDIMAIGKKRGFEKAAEEFIRDGKSIDQFRSYVVDHMPAQDTREPSRHVGAYAGERGYGGGYDDFSDFSVCRAIMDRVKPGSVDAGYEREISQELHQRTNKRDENIMVPFQRGVRSMVAGTGASGGYLVESKLYPDQFIDPLAPQSVLMQLNYTSMDNLIGDVTLPGASNDPAVGNYDLNDQDTITPTDPTLTEVSLTPTSIAGLTTLSHKFIRQASRDAEMMVRNMLGRSVGKRLDHQAIQGDGVGANLTGIINVTGIGSVTYANGGSPTWANVVGLESALTVDDVEMRNVAYLVHPTDAGTLKTTEVASGTGIFIMRDGKANDYPVVVSSQVPQGTYVIGAWSELIIGTWGILSLEIDPYTGFRKGNVDVRAILDCAAAVRNPESFATLTEAAP